MRESERKEICFERKGDQIKGSAFDQRRRGQIATMGISAVVEVHLRSPLCSHRSYLTSIDLWSL